MKATSGRRFYVATLTIGVLLLLALVISAFAFSISTNQNQYSSQQLIESDIWAKVGIVVKATMPWESIHLGEPSARWENGVYKMWYNPNDPQVGGLALATSTNGINFTKVGIVYTDAGGVSGIDVEKMPSSFGSSNWLYWLYYKGGDGNFHLAQSLDGQHNFTNYGVVLQKDTQYWEWQDLQNPSVLYDESNSSYPYKMLYESNAPTCNKIGYAYSPDGTHWTKYVGNPVITCAYGTASWKSDGVGNPYLFKWTSPYGNIPYYYVLFGGISPKYGGWAVGIAQSSDMVHWRESLSNPILTATLPTDGIHVADPTLIYNGETFLYYNSNQATISVQYSHASIDLLLKQWGF